MERASYSGLHAFAGFFAVAMFMLAVCTPMTVVLLLRITLAIEENTAVYKAVQAAGECE